MTIDEFCRQQHVSKKTVYGRLKERSIQPSALRDDKWQLTPEGLNILGSLFDSVSTQKHESETENVYGTVVPQHVSSENGVENAFPEQGNDRRNTERIHELETRIHALEVENAVLRAEKQGLTNEIQRLETEVTDAKAQRDYAQQMQQRLLPETVEHGRGGWFARIFGRK